MRPAALDGPALPSDYKGDRRQALADWMTAPDNPFFASVIVNRVWKHYMGRGLVEPVDDFRVTNPPVNEPLLTYLASDLRAHHYDLKHLMREILCSETYGRAIANAAGKPTRQPLFQSFSGEADERRTDAGCPETT